MGKRYTCAENMHKQFDAWGYSWVCSVAQWKVRLYYAYVLSLLPESNQFAICVCYKSAASLSDEQKLDLFYHTLRVTVSQSTLLKSGSWETIYGRNMNMCCFL